MSVELGKIREVRSGNDVTLIGIGAIMKIIDAAILSDKALMRVYWQFIH